MANLYTKEGWLNFDRVLALSSTLNVIIGARNSGKTYSTLDYLLSHEKRFVFVRTTKTQVDTIFTADLSPLTKLNESNATRYFPEKLPRSGITAIYSDYETDGKTGRTHGTGGIVGYAVALAQIGSMRGFEMPMLEALVYDEFVRHPGEVDRVGDKQFSMYSDLVFTLSRAREVTGKEPIKQFLLGNADDLSNPLISGFGLVETIIKMRQSRENYVKLQNRPISIFLLDDSPVAVRMREESELASLFHGTIYYDMALNNEFVYDDYSDCKPQALNAYSPLFAWGRVLVMRHKRVDRLYVRSLPDRHGLDGVPVYTSTERGAEQARLAFPSVYYLWLSGNIIFDTYETKISFRKLYQLDKDITI